MIVGAVKSVSVLLKPVHLADVDFLKTKLPVYSAFQRYQSVDDALFCEIGSEVDELPECFGGSNAADTNSVLKDKIAYLETSNIALKGFNDELYNASVDNYMKNRVER